MIGPARLFDRLEVVDDPRGRSAALNMAIDEALLEGLAAAPVLRFYRWQGPAVSFGYFDQAEPVFRAYPEREMVRRWTGGGVVEHARDFTYSLLVPRAHPLTALRAEESYGFLHGVLATAIAAAGSVAPVLTDRQAAAIPERVSRACFVNPVRHDLLLHGHKVAGAAQRRTRRGWLHQGSIQFPGETAQLYGRLRATLPSALGEIVERRSIRPDEMAAASRLAETKYGTDAWLRRF